ncbi:hypothetical protein JQX13_13110 [Archangium violaceum]|uniref:hypothetical protein n=1 Tax=Archangium violaceum TaxID=83451 RepID=UPI00193BA1C5|nr:hypothetical protein [Archangium violaceum]QRK10921.1 hypothetical protein JQX13_13110 [Archangium violaceum]
MHGRIHKWMVVGALASASLLVTGCENRGQGVEVPGQPDSRELEPATGGAGQPDSVDPLELDNQPSLDEPGGAAEPRQRGGSDAGTGGAGIQQETTGTSDQGGPVK